MGRSEAYAISLLDAADAIWSGGVTKSDIKALSNFIKNKATAVLAVSTSSGTFFWKTTGGPIGFILNPSQLGVSDASVSNLKGLWAATAQTAPGLPVRQWQLDAASGAVDMAFINLKNPGGSLKLSLPPRLEVPAGGQVYSIPRPVGFDLISDNVGLSTVGSDLKPAIVQSIPDVDSWAELSVELGGVVDEIAAISAKHAWTAPKWQDLILPFPDSSPLPGSYVPGLEHTYVPGYTHPGLHASPYPTWGPYYEVPDYSEDWKKIQDDVQRMGEAIAEFQEIFNAIEKPLTRPERQPRPRREPTRKPRRPRPKKPVRPKIKPPGQKPPVPKVPNPTPQLPRPLVPRWFVPIPYEPVPDAPSTVPEPPAQKPSPDPEIPFYPRNPTGPEWLKGWDFKLTLGRGNRIFFNAVPLSRAGVPGKKRSGDGKVSTSLSKYFFKAMASWQAATEVDDFRQILLQNIGVKTESGITVPFHELGSVPHFSRRTESWRLGTEGPWGFFYDSLVAGNVVIDWRSFMVDFVLNEIEDQLVGRTSRYLESGLHLGPGDTFRIDLGPVI